MNLREEWADAAFVTWTAFKCGFREALLLALALLWLAGKTIAHLLRRGAK